MTPECKPLQPNLKQKTAAVVLTSKHLQFGAVCPWVYMFWPRSFPFQKVFIPIPESHSRSPLPWRAQGKTWLRTMDLSSPKVAIGPIVYMPFAGFRFGYQASACKYWRCLSFIGNYWPGVAVDITVFSSHQAGCIQTKVECLQFNK